MQIVSGALCFRRIRKAFCQRAAGLRRTRRPEGNLAFASEAGQALHFTPHERVTKVRNLHRPSSTVLPSFAPQSRRSFALPSRPGDILPHENKNENENYRFFCQTKCNSPAGRISKNEFAQGEMNEKQEHFARRTNEKKSHLKS